MSKQTRPNRSFQKCKEMQPSTSTNGKAFFLWFQDFITLYYIQIALKETIAAIQ